MALSSPSPSSLPQSKLLSTRTSTEEEDDEEEEDDSTEIPLADSDPAAVVQEDEEASSRGAETAEERFRRKWDKMTAECESLDSIPSACSPRASSGASRDKGESTSSKPLGLGCIGDQMARQLSLDPDFSPDEAEEKARLISQVRKRKQGGKNHVNFLVPFPTFFSSQKR